MNYDRLKYISELENSHILPIKVGQFLELQEWVGEGKGRRIRKLRGLVIKVKFPSQANGSFTIRGTVAGMTIEKIYPLSFPNFEEVILLDEYKIRRSKLYYIRDKVGKDAKFKSLITQQTRNTILFKKQ